MSADFCHTIQCSSQKTVIFSLVTFHIHDVRFLSSKKKLFWHAFEFESRSQWTRGLRRRSAAARLLRLWIRITPGTWLFVCWACCVLSGRGLCNELITRSEESYRLWCVVVCDLETSWKRRPWTTGGCHAKNKQTKWIWSVSRSEMSAVYLHSKLVLWEVSELWTSLQAYS